MDESAGLSEVKAKQQRLYHRHTLLVTTRSFSFVTLLHRFTWCVRMTSFLQTTSLPSMCRRCGFGGCDVKIYSCGCMLHAVSMFFVLLISVLIRFSLVHFDSFSSFHIDSIFQPHNTTQHCKTHQKNV
jgi:hypothetical protein